MRRRRSLVAHLVTVAGGLALVGCAGDLELQRLAARSVDGSPFQQALFAEYVDLALTEAAEEDRRDARIFMDQAMRVADGETLDPLPVSTRELSPDDAATLEAARLRLLTALRQGGRVFAPITAARAQGFFECWLQEQEEGRETVEIDVCRRRFELALADTLTALDGDIFTLLSDQGDPSGNDDGAAVVTIATDQGEAVLAEAGASVLVEAADAAPGQVAAMDQSTIDALYGRAIEAQPEPPVEFILYFDTGSFDLTPESEALVADILEATARYTPPRIAVIGHTDRVGPALLNATLAVQRARRVEQALLDLGLAPESIELGSFGEADPLVPTPDEVAEPLNRRVEVTIR